MYSNLKRIEKILSSYEYYRVEIEDKGKTYLIGKDKKEEKEHSTNAVGFQIKSRNACEIEDKRK